MKLKIGLWWIDRKTGFDEGTEMSSPVREISAISGSLGLATTVRTYVPIKISEPLKQTIQNYFKHTINTNRYNYKIAFFYSE